MLAGQNVWQSTVRDLWNSLRQSRKGRRLRSHRGIAGFPAWGVAAEVMEARSLLSAPAYGQGFSAPFQAVGTDSGSSQAIMHTLLTNSSGNVYVAGQYMGTGNISPTGTDILTHTSTSGNTPLFIAKYNSSPSLNLAWAVAPGQDPSAPGGSVRISSMSLGSVSGDLYVAGSMNGGSIVLPTAQGTFTAFNAGFVMRLDHNTGNLVWFAEFGAVGRVATDAAENVYLCGGFSGTATYSYLYGPGNGGAPVSISSTYNTMGFLKTDSNGNAIWAGQFTPQNSSTILGYSTMTVDGAGNIYFGGSLIGGSVDCDPSSGVKIISTSRNAYGNFVVEKIDTNGHLVWVINNDSSPIGYVASAPSNIRIDGNGNIDVNVQYSYVVSVTKNRHGTTVVSGNLVQFDTNGNLKWYLNTAGGTPNGKPMALDPAGNIYVAVSNWLDKYSSTGALIWSISDSIYLRNLSIDSAGDIWFSASDGSSTGQVNVSPTSTPVYLPTNGATFELVEWTQSGGYAAAKLATEGTQTLAGAASSASTVPSPQQVIFVGDVSPAPSALPTPYDHMQQYRPLLTI